MYTVGGEHEQIFFEKQILSSRILSYLTLPIHRLIGVECSMLNTEFVPDFLWEIPLTSISIL